VPDPLPFELVSRAKGIWRAYWPAEEVSVEVIGTEEAPAPTLMDTLRDVITRWTAVKEDIATFVRGLDTGHHVPLDPPTIGGFAARSCGFDQPFTFQSVSVESTELPHRVVVTFYTGYPDGYASYAMILDHGVPTEVSAYAS